MRGRLQDNRVITADVCEGPQHARSVLSRQLEAEADT